MQAGGTIWDAVLKNIRVVVFTHAVLLDALSHGFVQVTQLALMIFDEGIPQRVLHLARDY